MKALILFAAWAPDQSENTQKWLNWYRDLFSREFEHCDKIVSVNFDSHPIAEAELGSLHRLLSVTRVPENMHINSDACSFQRCLSQAKTILSNYDYVAFFHTKGISYDFDRFHAWRTDVEKSVFSLKHVMELAKRDLHMICHSGHLLPDRAGILQCNRFAQELGIKKPFAMAATTTLYWAKSRTISELCGTSPRWLFEDRLTARGYNRFFFEAHFPSQIAALGDEPYFMGGCERDPSLNPDVSYDGAPKHNSALVQKEYHKWRSSDLYDQVPRPFIVGPVDPFRGPIRVVYGP